MFLQPSPQQLSKAKKNHQCSWATACSSGASASAALAAFSSASLASFTRGISKVEKIEIFRDTMFIRLSMFICWLIDGVLHIDKTKTIYYDNQRYQSQFGSAI